MRKFIKIELLKVGQNIIKMKFICERRKYWLIQPHP